MRKPWWKHIIKIQSFYFTFCSVFFILCHSSRVARHRTSQYKTVGMWHNRWIKKGNIFLFLHRVIEKYRWRRQSKRTGVINASIDQYRHLTLKCDIQISFRLVNNERYLSSVCLIENSNRFSVVNQHHTPPLQCRINGTKNEATKKTTPVKCLEFNRKKRNFSRKYMYIKPGPHCSS